MGKDFMYLGTAPYEEECVQVESGKDYLPAMREECNRFINLLRDTFGKEPEGARLAIRSEMHDFGSYLEVVCWFDEDIPESVEYAYNIEGNTPARWPSTPVSSLPDPPSEDELMDMFMDGECTATDGCLVEPDGVCPHGHKSWLLVLGMI